MMLVKKLVPRASLLRRATILGGNTCAGMRSVPNTAQARASTVYPMFKKPQMQAQLAPLSPPLQTGCECSCALGTRTHPVTSGQLLGGRKTAKQGPAASAQHSWHNCILSRPKTACTHCLFLWSYTSIDGTGYASLAPLRGSSLKPLTMITRSSGRFNCFSYNRESTCQQQMVWLRTAIYAGHR